MYRSTGYFVAGILTLRVGTRPTLTRRHPGTGDLRAAVDTGGCSGAGGAPPDGGTRGRPTDAANPTEQVGIAEIPRQAVPDRGWVLTPADRCPTLPTN
ncbi:hypothetical protein GCM10027259_15550 [Micromonospora palomenae]